MSDAPDGLPTYEDFVAAADGAYRPFEGFAAWSDLRVDTQRWQDFSSAITAQAMDPALLSRARDVAKRAAAIDTGALEELYSLDEGITITIATEAAYWQSAFEKQHERTRALIEAQLGAYDNVVDFATGARPIVEAWIRQLHEILCKNQPTYKVKTAVGEQEQPLPLGTYKVHPNHVLQPDNTIHSYAPVADTPPEMARLCSELASPAFQASHPLIQAAFVHHVATVIHPFADGNGRVARALASVYTYRAASIPFLVLVEDRTEYLRAIRSADRGERQTFVDFVSERAVAAFELVLESLRAAAQPRTTDELARLRQLYYTAGGYTHAQVDQAGNALLDLVRAEAVSLGEVYAEESGISIAADKVQVDTSAPDEGYRRPVNAPRDILRVVLQSPGPAHGEIILDLVPWVPKNCRTDDELLVVCLFNGMRLAATMQHLATGSRTTLRLRARMYLEGVFGAALADLRSKAEASLRKHGY